jgi:hypothetical protein
LATKSATDQQQARYVNDKVGWTTDSTDFMDGLADHGKPGNRRNTRTARNPESKKGRIDRPVWKIATSSQPVVKNALSAKAKG